ncbi:MAG: hypothetical protein V1875_09210 [Candidatus Altiarchaeota archaeon]
MPFLCLAAVAASFILMMHMAHEAPILFILFAVYCFLFKRGTSGYVFSSVFLGLVILSKVTSLAAVAGIFSMHLACSLQRGSKSNLVGPLMALLAPMAVMLVLAVAAYPNIVHYTVLSHQYFDSMGYLAGFLKILSLNPRGCGLRPLRYTPNPESMMETWKSGRHSAKGSNPSGRNSSATTAFCQRTRVGCLCP